MKTVADPRVLHSLTQRFHALTPQHTRRWGTMTPHEMLCHLGDAWEMVLRSRPRERPLVLPNRPLMKAIGLWSPLRWPHGWRTSPAMDPRAAGTKPSEFVRDRQRVVGGLEALAVAKAETLEPVHGVFGPMSLVEWQRWAWKHADHHLRQFGV